MNPRNLLAVVAMILVAVVSVAYMIVIGLPVASDIGVRRASFTVPQSNGLVVGSKVLYRGVEIGRVTAVDTSPAGVRVDWNYDDQYRVPAGSTLRVDNLSALGETYINVVPTDAGGSALANGAEVAAEQVDVPTTVDELSARVVEVLEQVSPDQVATITEAMNTGLLTDRSLLTNLHMASGLLERTIVATRAPLETLLDKFQGLLVQGSQVSGSLAAAGPELTRFGSEFEIFLDWCVKFIVADNLPYELSEGAGVFLQHALDALDEAAPDLKILGDAGLPAVGDATARLRSVDLSQLLRTAMATAGDGTGLVIDVGGK